MHNLGNLCVFVFERLFFLIAITHDVCVYRKPAVIMIVGVNGGGKTTSLGMFDVNGLYILLFGFWFVGCNPLQCLIV